MWIKIEIYPIAGFKSFLAKLRDCGFDEMSPSYLQKGLVFLIGGSSLALSYEYSKSYLV